MSDQITTAAELDAPPGSVLRDKRGELWFVLGPSFGSPTLTSPASWGTSPARTVLHDYGPLTVLYRPDQQPTVQPTVEQVADAIHAAWDLDTPEDDEPCYCDLDAINDAARAVLALIPGRTEAAVKAEALREAAAEWSDWDALTAPEEWLTARADRIEGATP